MKDWFYAFFMAWGMFLAIPCPFPRWRESARGRMLMCLPLIGLVEGGLWALLVWLLAKLCLPEALGALCAAAFPWLVTGFLHLDGYMDVCDAVLSRRDLATRQKILEGLALRRVCRHCDGAAGADAVDRLPKRFLK